MVSAPGAAIKLTNGKQLDPETGQEVAALQGEAVDLNNWFTLQFYTALQGMAEFRSLYSLRFADRQQVFRVGSGEQVTPGPGMQVVTCQDPIGGHIYGALHDPTLAADKVGGAVRLIQQCAQQAQAFLAQTPGSTAYNNARYELNNTIEWLNFLRAFYQQYGTNLY
jgi:hypothetical protein